MTRKQKIDLLSRISAGEPVSILETNTEIIFREKETGLYYRNGQEMTPSEVARYTSDRNNILIEIDVTDLNA